LDVSWPPQGPADFRPLLPLDVGMKCKICDVRKPRRYCPAVAGDICSLCCGTEREVSLRCPLDCVYLQEAHAREQLETIPAEKLPSPDIRITESFLEQHMPLVDAVGAILRDAALAESGAIDTDMQEALDAITRTWRTLESGLYYETRPENPIAAHIQTRVQEEIANLRKELASKGVPAIPDSVFLGILVFFHRMSIQYDNHRKYGRLFIGSFGAVPPPTAEPASAPLILPA
jgi:hypothetical protein